MGVTLFRALRDPDNPTGHPALAALLRAFCPQALYWWAHGAEPDAPSEPHDLALQHMEAGHRLGDALREAGFDEEFIRQEVVRYVDAVHAFREQSPGVPAPELTPLFYRVFRPMPFSSRFHRDEAARRVGGWDGFYEYVRTHSFLFEDWTEAMHLDPEATRVRRVRAVITARPLRRPVYLSLWAFADGYGLALALLDQSPADRLAADLVVAFGRVEGVEGLDPRPPVWRLTPTTAVPHRQVLPANGLERMLEQEAARRGPPVHVWPAGMYADRCGLCGFHGLCWERPGRPRAGFLFRDGAKEG